MHNMGYFKFRNMHLIKTDIFGFSYFIQTVVPLWWCLFCFVCSLHCWKISLASILIENPSIVQRHTMLVSVLEQLDLNCMYSRARKQRCLSPVGVWYLVRNKICLNIYMISLCIYETKAWRESWDVFNRLKRERQRGGGVKRMEMHFA